MSRGRIIRRAGNRMSEAVRSRANRGSITRVRPPSQPASLGEAEPITPGVPSDAPLGSPPAILVADVGIHSISFSDTVSWIVSRARSRMGGVVCTPNADYVVRAHRDLAFRQAIASADLRVPDGMAIVYASRLAGRPIRTTVTGRLLLPAVAEQAATEGWPIALFGAADGIAATAARTLQRRYPGLMIANAISPPMGMEVGLPDGQDALIALREGGARVIFVALGAPRQELWMAHHRDELEGVVLVGIGAALDIIAGRFREAPRWMTRIGLEWLFRLAQEPDRLARRYLLDDPWIFWWALKTRISS